MAVEAVREEWLVEDRWWTPKPLRRRYFELVLADGRNVVVFREPADGAGGRSWFLQRALSATSSCTVTPPTRSATGRRRPRSSPQRAAELGYEALAMTDHDGVWGAMEFAQACTAFGVRPIVGAE